MTWDLPGQQSPGEIKCEPLMEDKNFQQPHVKESKETDEINFNDVFNSVYPNTSISTRNPHTDY